MSTIWLIQPKEDYCNSNTGERELTASKQYTAGMINFGGYFQVDINDLGERDESYPSWRFNIIATTEDDADDPT